MSVASQTGDTSHEGNVAGFHEYLESVRQRPVYVILGVQGSGTNLLARLLGRIFKFSVLRDRSVVFNAAARLGTNPSAADVAREIEQFRSFLSPTTFDRLRGKKFIRKAESFAGIFNELTPATIRSGSDFARLVYAYRAYALGMRELAIKSDDIWEHIADIDTVLPNRRVILLTRDFRDNLVSIGGKHFGPVEPICAARYVKEQFKRYDVEYRRAGAHGFHVTFETLVEAPRRFVEQFAQHFGLVPAVDPEVVLQKMRFRPNKIAKWKRLNPQELAWCEAILRQELTNYGYALACEPAALPSSWTVAVANVRDSVKRVPQKLRGLGRRFGT